MKVKLETDNIVESGQKAAALAAVCNIMLHRKMSSNVKEIMIVETK